MLSIFNLKRKNHPKLSTPHIRGGDMEEGAAGTERSHQESQEGDGESENERRESKKQKKRGKLGGRARSLDERYLTHKQDFLRIKENSRDLKGNLTELTEKNRLRDVALQAREEKLDEREEVIESTKRWMAEWARLVDEKDRRLDVLNTVLTKRVLDIDTMERALDWRERGLVFNTGERLLRIRLGERERDLEARARGLKRRLKEVREREDEVDRRELDCEEWERELDEREWRLGSGSALKKDDARSTGQTAFKSCVMRLKSLHRKLIDRVRGLRRKGEVKDPLRGKDPQEEMDSSINTITPFILDAAQRAGLGLRWEDYNSIIGTIIEEEEDEEEERPSTIEEAMETETRDIEDEPESVTNASSSIPDEFVEAEESQSTEVGDLWEEINFSAIAPAIIAEEFTSENSSLDRMRDEVQDNDRLLSWVRGNMF